MWDEGLEIIVRNYVEKCDFNYNKFWFLLVGYYVGENLYVSYGMYMYVYLYRRVCVYNVCINKCEIVIYIYLVNLEYGVFVFLWYFN